MPRRDGKCQRIDHDVADIHAPLPVGSSIKRSPLGPSTPASRACPFLIDGERHNCSAMFLDDRHDALDSRTRFVAILVVHGVDDAPPTEQFQPASMTSGSVESNMMGRVEVVERTPPEPSCQQHRHDRRSRYRDREGGRHRGLVLRNLDAVVDAPSTIASRNAFDPFALVRSPIDRYVASCWKEPPGRPKTHSRCIQDSARRAPAPDSFDYCFEVFGRSPATTTNDVQPVFAGERVVSVGQLLWRQWIACPIRREFRQTRIRHDRQPNPGLLGKHSQVFTHLSGPGCAVHSNEVDTERLKRHERSQKSPFQRGMVPVVSTVICAIKTAELPTASIARLAPTNAALACRTS